MITEINEYMNTVKMDKSKHTIRSYQHAIDLFTEFTQVGSLEGLSNVTSAKCREFQSHLIEKGNQKSSINAYIRPLKALYNWLVENEYLESSPFGKVKFLKLPKTMRVILSEEEIASMVAACKNIEEKFIFTFMLTTGTRRDEVVNIKISDIEGNHVLIHGKGAKERRLILSPGIVEVLTQYLNYRMKKYGTESEYLLISKMRRPFSGQAILEKIQIIGRRAGIAPDRLEDVYPHTLRHTFATDLIGSGADIRVVQGALGHANLATTQIYAHLRDSALDAAMLNMKPIV